MQHLSSRRGGAVRRRALLLAAGAALMGAAPAAAAPITYDVGGGATLTLSNDEFAPGATIGLTGKGFTSTGGAGVPVVCVKLDDLDDLLLNPGGPSPLFDFEAGLPCWETDQSTDGGRFDGTVTLKSDISTTGPAGGEHAGKHWIRVLSGVPTTGVSVTVPITAQAYFRVVEPVEFGFTGTVAAGSTFTPGTTLTPTAPAAGPQGTYTVRGRAFPPGEAVAAGFDGSPLTLATPVTTDADGRFTTPVALGGTPPAPLASGDHALALTAGGVTHQVTVTVVAHTAQLLTPQIRSGETAVVAVTGFLGIAGTPQKVALIGAGDAVLSCTAVHADGSGLLAATVSGDPGPAILRVASGTDCAPPLVTDPVPRFFPQVGAGLAISAAAPVAGTAFTHATVGLAFPVTGAGFGAGEAVQARLDGAALGAPLVASASGELSGSLTLPAATALGTHVITFASATATAADTITAIAPPTISLDPSSAVSPGATVSFSLQGFRRGTPRSDGATGQKVGVRVDTGPIVACVQTDDQGSGTGSVELPASLAEGEHTLRFLAGSSCVSGQQNDLPARSIPVAVQVAAPPSKPAPGGETPLQDLTPTVGPPAPPVVTPPVAGPPLGGPVAEALDVQRAKRLKVLKGRKKLRLWIGAGDAPRVKITIKTKSKVRLSARRKAKTLTLVRSKTVRPKSGKARSVTLSLTRDARSLLRRTRKVKVVVTVDPVDAPGSEPTTRTLTLRR